MKYIWWFITGGAILLILWFISYLVTAYQNQVALNSAYSTATGPVGTSQTGVSVGLNIAGL